MGGERKSFDIVIIGAGLGGLSAAIHAAATGKSVAVLEKKPHPGGKCDFYRRDGFQLDTGPSVLTLPHVLDDLFTAAGRDRRDYLEIKEVHPGCRYYFADGTVFDAPGRMEDFAEALSNQFPGEIDGFRRFQREIGALWVVSGPAFLNHPFDLGLLKRIPWATALRHAWSFRPGSMQKRLQSFFRDPRLITLFSRFATYNGSDPRLTPATFNVIAHAELAFGSWHCRGGMYALVQAISKLAQEIGVELFADWPVESVTREAAGSGFRLESRGGNPPVFAEKVICNADALTALEGPLLAAIAGRESECRRRIHKPASSSGFVLLMGIARKFPSLACHNVFFPKEYDQEFEQLFTRPQPLSDPTIYISVPARAEPALAPPGQEGWFVLANAPSLEKFRDWNEAAYAESLIGLLKQRVSGLGDDDILWTHHHGPQFFSDSYGAWHGSLYGSASNNTLAAFRRVPNRSRLKDIYFCGGSAHPGGGIPLVLLSGRHAARAACGISPQKS